MFSKLSNRLLRSFSLRLNLWYAAVFTVSAAILFGVLYLLLASAVERKDHEVIEARLRACAAVYDSGGIAALQDFVQRSREGEKSRSFFVRVANQSGTCCCSTCRTTGCSSMRRRCSLAVTCRIWSGCESRRTRRAISPSLPCDCRTIPSWRWAAAPIVARACCCRSGAISSRS
jgi:hypothetical protein